MSTQKERRRARKIEKQRKKRTDAQRSRGSRTPRSRGADLSEVLAWPVGECWVGEAWHERGARVTAAFTRRRDDGQVAAALFEVDLAEQGVVRAEVRMGPEDAVMGELARWSEEEALVVAEPARVVTLVDAARRFGLAQGHEQASGLKGAAQLFGDVEPDDAQHEILCGTEETPQQAPPPQPGILARWKQRLGFGS